MSIDLAGKRALITRSSSGIGRATAASLAKAGAALRADGGVGPHDHPLIGVSS